MAYNSLIDECLNNVNFPMTKDQLLAFSNSEAGAEALNRILKEKKLWWVSIHYYADEKHCFKLVTPNRIDGFQFNHSDNCLWIHYEKYTSARVDHTTFDIIINEAVIFDNYKEAIQTMYEVWRNITNSFHSFHTEYTKFLKDDYPEYLI